MKNIIRNYISIFGLCILLWPIAAYDAPFDMPVLCDYGEECFIQNYVDIDHSSHTHDYQCGTLSYDGHKGTDFRLRDFKALEQNIAVRAAKSGTVIGIRNHMPDHDGKHINTIPSNRACGNGVSIAHEEGWVTQYCHLRKDTIVVQKGQRVDKGDTLGVIGMSGRTEFPHLHFSIRHHGTVKDPFAHTISPCTKEATPSLWSNETELPYIRTGILNIYFSGKIPNRTGTHYGKFRDKIIQKSKDEAVILWAELFGIRAGDELEIRITDPHGDNVANAKKQFDRSKAAYFQFGGKKMRSIHHLGTYHGNVTVRHHGTVIVSEDITVEVTQ